MNMGQLFSTVKRTVEKPERVYLVNRIDGELVKPMDIENVVRTVEGKGV